MDKAVYGIIWELLAPSFPTERNKTPQSELKINTAYYPARNKLL